MGDPGSAASQKRTGSRRIVLVGAGHAHAQVLEGWCRSPIPGAEGVLVVDRPEAVYSGMVPGFVAGDYRAAALAIDVRRLARRAGVRLVESALRGVDGAARRLELADGRRLAYDLASLDVGSRVRGLEVPGVSEHALATRPIGSFVAGLGARLADRTGPGEVPVVVVGAGAAGVELACTLEARLRAEGRPAAVEIVGDGPVLLPGASAALRRGARSELSRRGIGLRLGARVEAVEAGRLRLAGGEERACGLVLWATGAAPHPWLARTGLPVDARGFLRVRATLEVAGVPGLFAAGDCAVPEPPDDWVPRAGVYAVRQGPVLARNLLARSRGERLSRYRPQRDFLSLLNLGDRRALGGKFGAAFRGRWVWYWKDRIDRRFMARFPTLDDPEAGADPCEIAPGAYP